MNWGERIITGEEINHYLNGADGRSLDARVAALIRQQRATWPLFDEGYRSLDQMETKRIKVADSEVVIQLNPKRIRSTAAAVDKTSVEKRPCFLCAENLPVEEKGIAYGSDLIILCNPFPILADHLSIAHRDHVEQKIEGNIEMLLSLAAGLGPAYFTLYNGPRCGASAPDHLHFQACSRKVLPIEQDVLAGDALHEIDCSACEEARRDSFEMFALEGCGRSVVVFRGNDPQEIAGWFYRAMECLPREAEDAEPMMNLICSFDAGSYTLYLFPRSRHRPASFFAQGEQQILVSPGAIDMAGVVVVPERSHFEKLSGELMEGIYSEVSFAAEEINNMLEELTSNEGGGW